ncbi:MAG: glycoside hydrolase family 27 protein [Bacteroides sp.]|nr:glycoside hydrolase family 27 protein [Eubacterium sp.]MCM1419606.1 glycoside hydrolase family 27 protein [Roseburia sp.]MCM1463569.1 glycoside hydrolase family 27 protein [Bacteroides sp.]
MKKIVAKTAPMGWNSWDCYGASVTEEIVRRNADYMAKHLKKYGWEYIVVDIQWYEPTADGHEYHPFAPLCIDEYSRVIPAENRFPSSAGGKGFAPLAEYVHSLGLKFGIHMMRGIPREAVAKNLKIKGTERTSREIARFNSVCDWNPDMYGVDPEKEGARAYYDSVFDLYASWGVDYVKCDDICRELPHEEKELRLLSEALRGCGRDMVLSLSPGPALPERAELYKEVADLWRITDDFWDKWELLYEMFSRAATWCIHSGAGNWPDADMLPIGPILQDYDPANRTKFTRDEQVTMMTLWSIFRSPLMIGGEMTGFDDFTLSLVTNEKILAMHKNARHAHPVWRRTVDGTEWIVWAAESAEGGRYVAFFNAGDQAGELSLTLDELELSGAYRAEELWSGEKLTVTDRLSVSLPPHGAKAFLLSC